MSEKIKKYSLQLFKLLFAGGLLYWMLLKGNLDIQSFRSILNIELVVVCYLLLIFMLSINHLRWWWLLKARQFDVTYLNTLALTFIGLFFNFVMPGSVGGDVVKGYYLCKDHPERKMDAALTILMDRVIGIFAMMSLALLGVLLSWEKIHNNLIIMNLFWLILSIFTGVLFIFVFFLLQNDQARWLMKISKLKIWGIGFLLKVLGAFQAYRHHTQSLLAAFLFSLVSQMIAVVFFVYVGQQLGETFAFEAYLFAVALGFIASSIPISPGGIGVGQVAFFFFFKTYTGQDLQVGSIGITIQQAVMFSLGLLGGLLYLRTSKSQSNVKELRV